MRLPSDELRYVLPIAALLALFALWVNCAHSTEGFSCEAPIIQPNPNWQLTTCWSEPGTPYVRDDAPFPYPSAWMQKRNGSTSGNIFVQFDGWGYTEINAAGVEAYDITVQSVYSHYAPGDPRLAWPKTFSAAQDLDGGGALHGKCANCERLGVTLDEIANDGYRIKALSLGGNCYGGAAVINQSVLMPARWQQRITGVFAMLPGTATSVPYGAYWDGRFYWDYKDGGRYDIDSVDPSKNTDKLQNVYYRIQAASPLVDNWGYDPAFVKNVCDKGHVYCFAFWSDQNHAWPDPKISPEYRALQNQSFAGPDMKGVVEYNKMRVVPTHSSANYYTLLKGHYNQGIIWNTANMIDSFGNLVVPITYVPVKNMWNGFPDQPDEATINLHLRPVNMPLPQWTLVDWTYKKGTSQEQSGQALVTKAGEVSIRRLVLSDPSLDLENCAELYTDTTEILRCRVVDGGYSDLILTPAGLMPGC